jgi:muramoyltetrapeptide carboxypeptidase
MSTSRKIQPLFLKEGDEVAIISPSFCIDENILFEAVKFLEAWGLKVRIGRNAAKRNGPFAGNDKERLSDIQEMTDSPEIKAVLCSRGGYGLSKIIDRIDFSALIKNPKWYSGFSDITVLHTWLNEVCGIMSIHGEMPLNFNNSEKSEATFTTLKKALFGEALSHEWNGSVYRPSDVTGELTGGNLSLLFSLKGTKADPVTRGKILFIEDVGEYYYHIDRMMTSFKLSGHLEDLSALIVGGMNKITDIKIPWEKSVEETIFDIVKEYNYPVIFNFPAGHIKDNRALYIGKEAKIEIKGDKIRLQYHP